MISNLILVILAILLSAAIVPLGRRLNAWLAFALIAVLLAVVGAVAVGTAVSVERFSNYSNYTARYLEYSRELRRLAEKGQFDKLPRAIVYFDTKVQSDSQSPDALAGAVQAIRTGDFELESGGQANGIETKKADSTPETPPQR